MRASIYLFIYLFVAARERKKCIELLESVQPCIFSFVFRSKLAQWKERKPVCIKATPYTITVNQLTAFHRASFFFSSTKRKLLALEKIDLNTLILRTQQTTDMFFDTGAHK